MLILEIRSLSPVGVIWHIFAALVMLLPSIFMVVVDSLRTFTPWFVIHVLTGWLNVFVNLDGFIRAYVRLLKYWDLLGT